ncbi:PAC2 family protein [Salana multivorans]|uniref:PAC2 family protein n=1 Tax=Salana multivorans TaxID=120377 RepID=A0A3N2D0W1_9MICO|nr:PAC2 family protein [Salana multivorans]OJX94228.1 MAG: carboxylate--amine ligase [Micrococcales bacterium 73-15]ROR93412.1 PAC2 family protein [Salana multivorans]
MVSTKKPLVIAAFEGWNDAGDAASDAVALIASTWGATPVASLDPELYYDFQVNRPILDRVGDGTTLTWPATRISVATSPVTGRQLLLVQGVEPSMRWRHYCAEILAATAPWEPELVVGVGALLADVPHTRPIPVQSTSEQAAVREQYGVEQSEYTGPVGILSVLAQAAADRGIGGMSVWAAVPHYVAQPPSPKATLALVSALEQVLGEPLPVADLVDESRAWQRGVDELAGEDPEISEYVRQLEEAKDTVELPEASGEAIAAEFERYLRRRDPGEGRDAGPR